MVNKLAYRFRKPAADDLVVYDSAGRKVIAQVAESLGSSGMLKLVRLKPGPSEGATAEVAEDNLVGRVWLVTH